MALGSNIINFPIIKDCKGDLTFIENNAHIPFDIKRVYYLFNVPAESIRGGHAHKNLTQVLIAISGSFDIVLDNGATKETFTLNNPSKGLLIDSFVWRELKNFSSNAVCLVLASELYNEEDYYRNYQDFLDATKNGSIKRKA